MSGFGRPEANLDPKKLRGLAAEEFRVPDIVGVETGWRAWNVKRQPPLYGNAPRLESATYAYYWAPRVAARAECAKNPAHVPGEDCACGFYAAKTLEHLREMGYSEYDENGEYVTVVGKMAQWGKVIEGTQGWRAEYAYPSTIYVPFEAWRLAAPISRAYGIPTKLLNLLDPDAKPDQAREIRRKKA